MPTQSVPIGCLTYFLILVNVFSIRIFDPKELYYTTGNKNGASLEKHMMGRKQRSGTGFISFKFLEKKKKH